MNIHLNKANLDEKVNTFEISKSSDHLYSILEFMPKVCGCSYCKMWKISHLVQCFVCLG